ncbi:uncharacterized protein ACOB7L_013147 isoform 1-T1 [Callospermophilus lateralis]|uniref:uncharacterized protein LOC143395643 n=1 Tax=Callospermophilus lateralis TaxID=76772 RepID=UPI004038C3FD
MAAASGQRYVILKTDIALLSLRIKEIFGKVCILSSKSMTPQTEQSKGPIQHSNHWWKHLHPVSLKSLKWTLPLGNQDGSPLWGHEENGLIQECCDNTQPRQGSFNMDSMK